MVWLANHLSNRGEALRADQVISTGSLTGIQPTRAGDQAIADFGPLGCALLRLTG